MRTKLRDYEYGDKLSKYFFSLEKRRYADKLIMRIVENNVEITEGKGILAKFGRFYSELQ